MDDANALVRQKSLKLVEDLYIDLYTKINGNPSNLLNYNPDLTNKAKNMILAKLGRVKPSQKRPVFHDDEL